MQQYFTEQAENYEEAYRKVREKYGEGATILFRKTVMIPCGFFGVFRKEGVEVSGPINQVRVENLGSYQQAIGGGYTNVPDLVRKNPAKEPLPSREPLDFNNEKMKVLAAAGQREQTLQKDPAFQKLAEDVKTIIEKITEPNPALNHKGHPTLSRIEELLILNDFSPAYRAGILERIKKEFPLDSLNNTDMVEEKVLEWIGKSIIIHQESKLHRRPRIMILVGPTGVGKTTTIAKLAANFLIDKKGQRAPEIVLITIDTFRIGAPQQLETYSKILESPCYAIDKYEELEKTIAVNSDNADIVLIDTIGKSPRDMVRLGEMKQLLDACGSQAEVHLVISAGTKSSDVVEILQQFEPFNYQSIIITKLDETTSVGNIVGVLAEKQKPVSYITNGQKVPADIQKASVITFLINLEGFKVNRTKLEECFPLTDIKQLR